MIFLALLVLLVLPSLPPTKKPRAHIAEGFLCIFQIVKISERILGAQENPLRSLLSVNEKGIYRSATPKTPLICASFQKKHQRVHIAEGFLCQMKERVRSLLCVGEELAP